MDRLYVLDTAIERYPDAPVNYLLRGEFWFEQGDLQQAQADFIKVCDLAEQALQTSGWGYIYQSYLDRAEQRLTLFAQQSRKTTLGSFDDAGQS